MKLNNLRTRVTALLIAAAMTAALAPAALAENENTENTGNTGATSGNNEGGAGENDPVVLGDPDDKYAENATINITDSPELIEAILNQADGQTWVLAPGTYDIGSAVYESDEFTINNNQHFVFPIVSDNLTIKGDGTGEVIITSSFNPHTDADPAGQGGNWHNQNFITIDAVGVKILDLDLKANPNTYDGDICNKAIELIGSAQDFTLRNVDIIPLENPEGVFAGTVFSGSIYFNVENAGTSTLENVTLSAWINAKTVTAGDILVKNVTNDFTNNSYAGFSTENDGYAWTPGVSGDNVTLDGFTIKVDSNINFVKQVTDKLRSGTTIELTEDITVDEMAYINGVDNITINGNDHEITASDNFVAGTHGQINLFKVEGDAAKGTGKNITLNDVNLVATASNKNTLDLYQSEVVLNNVVLDNQNTQGGAAMIVNGANVDVTGSFQTITGDKSWYAINVDSQAHNVSASLDFTNAESVTFSDESAAKNKLPLVLSLQAGDNAEAAVPGADKAGLELTPSGQFLPQEIHVSTEAALRTAVAIADANIVLDNDIELTSNLRIGDNGVTGVTINGNGYKIFADDSFAKTNASSTDSVITVVGNDLTLKNITLQTGVNNAHALNLFQAQGVALDNVTLDHTTAYKGAPLIVASSEVTAQNGLKVIAGAESWYGINLDNGTGDNKGSASLTFADENVTFVDNSGKDLAFIKMDTNPNVTDSNTVVNPGNADLVVDENGNYVVCDHSKTEIRNNKDATPDSEGYTGDTYCSICGKLLSTGTVVAKVDEHPEIGEAIANGTWGKDEATATPKPATSAAGSTATVTTTNNSIPQTADEMNIGLLMMLLVVSAAGLTGTVLYTRKNKAK